MGINELAAECHRIAREHGFWDSRDPSCPVSSLAECMLISSEVAEAAEAIRNGNADNFLEELADVVIRVFDSAGARGLDLETAILDKMEKNRRRPHMHGGKLA